MDATYIGNSLSTPNPPDMKNGAFGAGFPLRGHYGALRKAGLRSRNLKWSRPRQNPYINGRPDLPDWVASRWLLPQPRRLVCMEAVLAAADDSQPLAGMVGIDDPARALDLR